MRYLIALFALVASSSNAALWEISFTDIAFLPEGRNGVEAPCANLPSPSLQLQD